MRLTFSRRAAVIAGRPQSIARRGLAAKFVSVRFAVATAKRGVLVAHTKSTNVAASILICFKRSNPRWRCNLLQLGSTKTSRRNFSFMVSAR